MVEFCPEASKATANMTDSTPDLATAISTPLLSMDVLDRASNKPKNDGSFTAPDLKTATPMMRSREFTTKARVS